MPEAENRRLFQQYFDEAANGGNLDLLDEIFAPDYLHHDPANPDPRPVVGPQGVRDHLTSLMGAFPDLKFEVDDMVAQRRGDRRPLDGSRHEHRRLLRHAGHGQADRDHGHEHVGDDETARRSKAGSTATTWRCCSSSASSRRPAEPGSRHGTTAAEETTMG